jgi:arsenite oxidase small subunit
VGVNLTNSRRRFLKAVLAIPPLVALEGLAVTRWFSSSVLAQAPSQFPRAKVANVNSLNGVLNFNYPLDNEPNGMVKLGQKAVGGIGPDGDIVAFSLICQHMGCIYDVNGTQGFCSCHGSRYDLANGGAVLNGPTQNPVPQVQLELDSSTGDISATGMTPPAIFGHNAGSDYVSSDLQGGTPVPEFPSLAFPLLASFVIAIGMALRSLKHRVKRRRSEEHTSELQSPL